MNNHQVEFGGFVRITSVYDRMYHAFWQQKQEKEMVVSHQIIVT